MNRNYGDLYKFAVRDYVYYAFFSQSYGEFSQKFLM